MDEIASLKALIAELRNDIDKQDKKLAERDHSLQKAEKERKTAARKIETLKHRLSKYQCRVRELEREKDDVAEALRVTQFEFNSLYQTATRQMEEMELKRKSIEKKERKISELKQRLKSVENELQEANQQIPALEENLHRVEMELERKSERVEEMRGNVNDMRLLLDMNHKVLGDYLMQQTAVDISYDRYMQEVQVR